VSVTIKFIGALRHISGKSRFSLPFNEGGSIHDLINKLIQQVPELERIFCDNELNNARLNSLILVNGKEISILHGYETKLSDRDEIVFVPVIHGG
jgi:MoaD family protein